MILIVMLGTEACGNAPTPAATSGESLVGGPWRELAQGDPAPDLRNIASVVFDPEHAQVLMFGGGKTAFLDDIWAWDGMHWAQVATSAGGLSRTGSAGAYDPVRHTVLLSGGVARPGGPIITDTWEWDGQAFLCLDGCQWRWKSIRPNRGARHGGRAALVDGQEE